MARKFTQEEFIQKANEIHNNKYDYSKTNYINKRTKITITCPIHGDFEQLPSGHINGRYGCIKCGNEHQVNSRTRTRETFIVEASIAHENKYDYTLITTDFIKTRDKLPIICPKHGVFYQRADAHLEGKPCKQCSDDLKTLKMKGISTNKFNGWKYTDWEIAGESSNNFKAFSFYILECYNNNEKFYKIGKTFTSIERRYSGPSMLPYTWKLHFIASGESRTISELEHLFHRELKQYKYRPILEFGGWTECFSTDSLSIIDELIKKEF